MILIALCAFLFLFSAIISQMITNKSDYKYYKTTYDALMSGKYFLWRKGDIFDNECIYTFKRVEDKEKLNDNLLEMLLSPDIIFFTTNNEFTSVKLLSPTRDSYIHKVTSGFDLYTIYWFKKICEAALTYDFNDVETLTNE